ncbi:GntR family transcriptional regulator [Microbacterium resistens]|uniref:GntR family transcriptional regulator n=1 Tax=Microbacterium resistens TaxID=156977 RepID=A0ABY3RPN9_9MICO|nr:GntR family transcriptional regulator [Microbacterium resistens]MBW1640587.1 GntR family transcriptional regulator [Microbacterium resistens]UGS26023.1 GntR family transcriptional regulator [Microbacterium resistens]
MPTIPLPAIDRASDAPIWFQIMRGLEQAIADGALRPGDRLPSEHRLCEDLRVSRTSVREALAKLEKGGVISRQQGKGAFVELAAGPSAWTLPSAPSLLGEYGEHGRSALSSTIIRAGIEPLPSWAAATVGRDTDGQGFVLERVRAVGARTAVHVVNYMPARFSGILPDLRDPRASLYAAITRVTGVRIARMHRTIEAATADRVLGALLEVEIGHPVVVVEAVAYDADGVPIDVSRASVRTDRMRVSVDTGFDAHGLPGAATSGTYPGGNR